MQKTFVHLRLHTEYSLVDSLVRIKPLAARVAKLNMPALAITDISNLFALVKFQKVCVSAGIKPIYGLDIELAMPEYGEQIAQLCVLAKSLEGYRNLTRLISEAYRNGQQTGRPVVQWENLKKWREGLIVLSGGRLGLIGQLLLSNQPTQAEQVLEAFLKIFPDHFYLELQRTGRENEEDYLHQAAALAQKYQCPVVATNDVRFIHAEEFEAHEVRVCIHEGCTLEDPKRSKNYSEQQYLRSPEEMWELFSDIPEALENTVEIAKRCNVDIPLGVNYLPNYPVPEGLTLDEFFRQKARKGLQERLEFLFGAGLTEQQKAPYLERLEEELGIIIQMGFPGYFLIVMDFIHWAKQNGVPVGPGRGSGAGSLVAYALKITDLDPLEYGLLFERFLNPERVSMPDFDIDFCMDGRDRVIEYVADTYGRNAVSQIITFGAMAAKGVVRDVGRVQGKPYGFVDRIAKLVPFELGMTLTKALEEEPQLKELYDQDEEIRDLLNMALKLEGLSRNVGKHAGGVVIAPSELTDFVPLYCDEQGDNLVTQFDKDDVEQAGLVKFDFLGLRTLTIIDWALKNIAQNHAAVDINRIPLKDEATFQLLQAGKTTAVFQLESRGMKDLIKRLKPSCFEDIVALVALFRPGPLQSGMVDDFINRKHGRAQVEYPHPWLEPILSNTYGVILYQEQVMQIAQVLAGYTLGGADMLRRAMGKKKPEEMAKQREIFLTGSQKLGINQDTANYIFDLMEKFAGYGFNKSHSAAYALLSYQTAWLKTHYPAEFMAAVLSSDMDNTDKVVGLVEECRAMNLEVRVPDVNYSEYKFTVAESKIIYGLGAVKGVGEGSIEAITQARKKEGEYRDLFDFCKRVDLKKVNRRCLEALCRCGALDALGPHRGAIFASLDDAVQSAEQSLRNQNMGMMDLFGEVNASEIKQFASAPNWSDHERLRGEKDTLGLYLTGHPIEAFEPLLQKFIAAEIVRLKPANKRGQTVIMAGLLLNMRTMKNKKGGRMAFLSLEDRTGRIEVSVFSDLFEESRACLVKDEILVVEGEVSQDEYSGLLKVVARSLYSLDQAKARFARKLCLSLNKAALQKAALETGFAEQLAGVLEPYRFGQCPVWIDYSAEAAQARLKLGEEWKVSPDAKLLERLKRLPLDRVEVEY